MKSGILETPIMGAGKENTIPNSRRRVGEGSRASFTTDDLEGRENVPLAPLRALPPMPVPVPVPPSDVPVPPGEAELSVATQEGLPSNK